MPETMMEMMRRRRATSAHRSLSASDAYDQQISNKAAAAKEQLGHTNGLNEDTVYIAQLSHHYYTMQAAYTGRHVKTVVVHSDKRNKFWGRVQEACKKADVSPERYMKAQFQFFHHAFGTTPKLCNLSTDSAVDRAVAFEGKTTGKTVGNAIEAKLDLGSLFSRCDQQVRDVCNNRKMTREEYYKTFVITGLIPMPKKFLEADPVYRRVADARSRSVRGDS